MGASISTFTACFLPTPRGTTPKIFHASDLLSTRLLPPVIPISASEILFILWDPQQMHLYLVHILWSSARAVLYPVFPGLFVIRPRLGFVSFYDFLLLQFLQNVWNMTLGGWHGESIGWFNKKTACVNWFPQLTNPTTQNEVRVTWVRHWTWCRWKANIHELVASLGNKRALFQFYFCDQHFPQASAMVNLCLLVLYFLGKSH